MTSFSKLYLNVATGNYVTSRFSKHDCKLFRLIQKVKYKKRKGPTTEPLSVLHISRTKVFMVL